jgi:hypothetical protein
MTGIDRLLEASSDPLAEAPRVSPPILDPYKLGSELLYLLRRKNGFYAFDSALHVFPVASANGMSLEEWNAGSLWRDSYKEMSDGLLFFAEDILQDQFCLSLTADAVLRFSAETGETAFMAKSIEEWADLVVGNYRYETGWPLASQWQADNGPLPPGKRLMPKTPFFLGGEYSVGNLWAGDAIEGMRGKSDIAMQTRALPNGSAVRLTIGSKPKFQ